jgi:hypothetical protein
MDGSNGKDRQALKRIVALLLALAMLADRARTRPRPIRVAVLWLLRGAESIARDFVIAVAREAGVDPDPAVPPHAHDIADDAGRLARSFTALAGLLAGLARGPLPLPAGRIGGLVGHLMRALRKQALRKQANAPGVPEQPPPDTS